MKIKKGCVIGEITQEGCRVNHHGNVISEFCNQNFTQIANLERFNLPVQTCQPEHIDNRPIPRWVKPCAGNYCSCSIRKAEITVNVTWMRKDCNKENEFDIFPSSTVFNFYPGSCVWLEYGGEPGVKSCYGNDKLHTTLQLPAEPQVPYIQCYVDYFSPRLPHVKTGSSCLGEFCFISATPNGDVYRGCVKSVSIENATKLKIGYTKSFTGIEQWICNSPYCNTDLKSAESSWPPELYLYRNISNLREFNVFYIDAADSTTALVSIYMGSSNSRNKTEPRGDGVKLAFDPDEKWSNLYREREKNHIYKWVGVRKGGELINIYERDGEDGVLKFAEEKLSTLLYNEGREPKLVTYSDYVKWKKGVNVQLGLNEEGIDMLETKFKEHFALWKLNKRGVEGENLIHLLLNREQQVCYEIARILIKRFPGLANDIYLGDEQFGQSALHLAIVHDDYETVSLLLNNKADVNARACGNFFLPEDFKLTNKITDYQGYAYYGEYPLAFAACFGNKDIYDLLIQFGANPNLQDSFGNTILHMCVINYSSSMYSYAVRHWAKPADPHVVNHAGFTPLTLATKLGRKHIFEEMLEIMKVEFWRFSDMTCSAYPLNTLDTIQPDGSTNYDSALMTVINGSTPEHLDMIGSEVIQRLLADKWKAFAQRKLIERLVLLIFQLITLSIVVYIRPTELERLYMKSPQWDDYIRTACEVLTILNCLFFVCYQQVGEIRTQGVRGYLRNLKTAPAKAVFCIANLFLLLCIPFRFLKFHEIEEALFVFALPGSWIFLLFFARSAKLTGPFVQMIYSMIAGDMIRFAIISAIFLVSFSQVFYFVGKDMDAKQKLEDTNPHACRISGYTIYTYNTFPETFITLFRASMGGYDYEEFSCANYEPLTKTLFVLYMFVMPIMMINILIAMMGNTYTTVIAQAEKAWRQQYAQIVMVLERSVGKERLAASQLEYSIRLDQEGSSGMEVRGLMVIKQTKKTRARQRKQAIYNWKNIGRKVIHTIDKVGTEQAILLLHGHDRLDRVYEEHQEKIPSRSRTPTRLQTSTHSSKRVKATTSEVKTDENVNNMLLSAPPSLANEGSTLEWQPTVTPVEERSEYTASRSESNTPPKEISCNTAEVHRSVRVRGVDAIPSVEVPNMPSTMTSTPPHRAISPRIRSDLHRRRESPQHLQIPQQNSLDNSPT
ncbi:unnamed protein product [Caenorhabditis bovis]|uniref:Ion transport domain-containing protein n=1 Tax=Caenorhabditis bovis TaxID=2654633 RepID=A0A8S1FD71_9PELO|nr:unnamed protein product [Caenorhabditis bovis]